MCYKNKTSRVMDKFVARMKWFPMKERYTVFTEAIEMSQKIKKDNI